MPITTNQSGSVTVTGNGIKLYRLMSLRSALTLELRGMKLSRGLSAYAIIKKEFNLKGNKQKVYDQFYLIVEKARAEYKND